MLSLHNPDPTGGPEISMLVMQGTISLSLYDVQLHPEVRTQMTQRWQCTHCSQKPVADSEDNQMASVLDKKIPGVHQYQLSILQWNANGNHRELPLLEDLLEATDVDVAYIQETKLQSKYMTPELRNISAVRHNRPVHGGKREGSL